MTDRKLTKEIKTKIEALVIAIPRELEAYEFYLNLAEEYEDKASREMFMFLAQQELSHKEKLEEILADMESKLEKIMLK